MTKNLTDIKLALASHVGKQVKLKAYEPRNIIVEHSGTLSNTYPSVFVIDLDSAPKTIDRVSYNYTDILTGYVELNFNK